MVSFDYLNSVSRQINSTSALFPLSVPLESLSESFLKASFFHLSLKKKEKKGVLGPSVQKKEKSQKTPATVSPKRVKWQSLQSIIKVQCCEVWSVCTSGTCEGQRWCEPVPLNPQFQTFMTNHFRSAAFSIPLTLHPGHIQYMIVFTSSISP